MGAVLVLVTAWAFRARHALVGYALGGMLTFVVLLVSTTDICIPSLIYRSIFGWPRARETRRGSRRRQPERSATYWIALAARRRARDVDRVVRGARFIADVHRGGR
jgi:hypothetical protein